MLVQIATPFAAQSPMGNSTSARRIAGILKDELDCKVELLGEATQADADLLIVLHAVRSAHLIERFRASHPTRPLVLILPGSDLYAAGAPTAIARQSMRQANALVIAQAASLEDVPAEFRSKTHLVPKSLSASLPERNPSIAPPFHVHLSAHLREQKNPQLAIEAARLLPMESAIRICHFGESLDPQFTQIASQASAECPHYSWLGNQPHEKVLADLSTAHLALNTSKMEGGANAVCEAIHLGVPILASEIPGNIGMLGKTYPGYFLPTAEPQALADLLVHAEQSANYRSKLTSALELRAPLFTREAETKAWRTLLNPLLASQ